jgi:hypothetical protein
MSVTKGEHRKHLKVGNMDNFTRWEGGDGQKDNMSSVAADDEDEEEDGLSVNQSLLEVSEIHAHLG